MNVGSFKDFKEGCRDAVPICLGYIAVSFAFGIEASKIGMTTFQAAMTSLLNVTSAGQFSALEVIARNGREGYVILADGKEEAFPSYDVEAVDTTGAGDTFAGGFMGYLAGINKTDFNSLKKAVIYGTIMSSFNVESFSLKKLSSLTKQDIQKRLKKFKEIMKF